jgi:hypothetical protein
VQVVALNPQADTAVYVVMKDRTPGSMIRALHRMAWLVAFVGACGCGGHPSDERLLDVFKDHRSKLEQLVRMFEADRGLGRVGEHFTRPEDPWTVGISFERVVEYRRLCAAVGAPGCIEGFDATLEEFHGPVQGLGPARKDPIWIHVSSLSLSISRSAKGFLHSTAPSFEVVANLDDFVPPRSGTWLRHIDGPWYLYLDLR